jgi:chemotaxis protein histidine kinase CheA
MSNVGTIWVVISATEAKDKLVELIDSGYLAQAVGYSSALDSLIDKMKLSVQQYGGSIPLAVYERIIMQIPSSLAEQIPNIIAGYSDSLNNKVAVGFGVTMEEASRAAQKSRNTGKIELYAHDKDNGFMEKNQAPNLSPGIQLPPNLYNPNVPDNLSYIDKKPYQPRPAPQQEAQSESAFIQSVVEQIGGMSQQEMQQQMQQIQQQAQQMQQAQQQQADSPRNLLQTLSGQASPGGKKEDKESKDSPKKEESKESESTDAADLKEKVTEAEESTGDDKIAAKLDNLKEKIPQIMGLSESNPKAFKATMDMINKLLSLAKENQKVKKRESLLVLQELAKAIDNAAAVRPKSNGIHYPVGTRLGRFKKVMANGKQVWREMSSGQVQDNTGQAISVKEANKQAKQ